MDELERLRRRDAVFAAHIEALRDVVNEDMGKTWMVATMRGILNDLDDALRRCEDER